MPSSISSSEPDTWSTAQLKRASIFVLVAVAFIVAALELGTRAFIYGLSNELERTRHEYAAATGIREGKTVLLVGNSLLLEDVDMEQLNRGLAPEWQAERFGVRQTSYYDWYFGLQKLFDAGARPNAVLVCFEPRHIVQTGVRQEIFAQYLMRKRDLVGVSHALDLSLTDSADLLVANVSSFYALRKELRKNLLTKLLPELPELMALITRSSVPQPEPEELERVGAPRLQAMRDIVAGNGSRLMLVAMPPVRDDHVQGLQDIGARIGMPVLAPLRDGAVAKDEYDMDGYHLSAQGRERFTQTLIPALRQQLSNPQ